MIPDHKTKTIFADIVIKVSMYFIITFDHQLTPFMMMMIYTLLTFFVLLACSL